MAYTEEALERAQNVAREDFHGEVTLWHLLRAVLREEQIQDLTRLHEVPRKAIGFKIWSALQAIVPNYDLPERLPVSPAIHECLERAGELARERGEPEVNAITLLMALGETPEHPIRELLGEHLPVSLLESNARPHQDLFGDLRSLLQESPKSERWWERALPLMHQAKMWDAAEYERMWLPYLEGYELPALHARDLTKNWDQHAEVLPSSARLRVHVEYNHIRDSERHTLRSLTQAAHAIESLTLRVSSQAELPARDGALLWSGAFPNLRRLSVRLEDIPPSQHDAFVTSTLFAHLHELRIARAFRARHLLDALFQQQALPDLRVLRLHGSAIDRDTMELMVDSESAERLETFEILENTSPSTYHLQPLLRAPMSSLRAFRARRTELDAWALQLLGGAPWLRHLKELELWVSRSDSLRHMLEEMSGPMQLETLTLHAREGLESLELLGPRGRFPELRELNLSKARCDVTEAIALIRAGRFPALEVLHLPLRHDSADVHAWLQEVPGEHVPSLKRVRLLGRRGSRTVSMIGRDAPLLLEW